MLPKFHCELNPIESVGTGKAVYVPGHIVSTTCKV